MTADWGLLSSNGTRRAGFQLEVSARGQWGQGAEPLRLGHVSGAGSYSVGTLGGALWGPGPPFQPSAPGVWAVAFALVSSTHQVAADTKGKSRGKGWCQGGGAFVAYGEAFLEAQSSCTPWHAQRLGRGPSAKHWAPGSGPGCRGVRVLGAPHALYLSLSPWSGLVFETRRLMAGETRHHLPHLPLLSKCFPIVDRKKK